MATKYARHTRRDITPQSEPIFGSSQVKNSAGGYSWEVNDWVKLDRFLVLGCEGSSYYASERKMTQDNAKAVLNCIAEDGVRVVARVRQISEQGRAPKNDPALFVLALASAYGDDKTRSNAYHTLSRVARTGTHLFTFLQYRMTMKRWGRGLRDAVSVWYTSKEIDQLAYQLVKYRNREGWSHRDVLSLAHPEPVSSNMSKLFKWVMDYEKPKKYVKEGEEVVLPPVQLIADFSALQEAKNEKSVIKLLEQNPSLSWEMIPSEFLSSGNVWRTLLPNLPMTALIRNLGRMTANECLKPLSKEVRSVCNKITNISLLKKARIHPITVLAALTTYSSGTGRSTEWEAIQPVADALDEAFYLTFENVESTNKRWLLGLDVSGSMDSGRIASIPSLTPRMASAAMALITAAREPNHHMMAFCERFVSVDISPRMRLDEVIRKTNCLPFGGTNCSLPMIWATKNEVEVDVFVVYTDSETWCGDIHPVQALQKYRSYSGIPAKLIVVGMVANNFTIADPNDAGMLDVVGFDTATPQLMSDFAVN